MATPTTASSLLGWWGPLALLVATVGAAFVPQPIYLHGLKYPYSNPDNLGGARTWLKPVISCTNPEHVAVLESYEKAGPRIAYLGPHGPPMHRQYDIYMAFLCAGAGAVQAVGAGGQAGRLNHNPYAELLHCGCCCCLSHSTSTLIFRRKPGIMRMGFLRPTSGGTPSPGWQVSLSHLHPPC